MIATFFLPLPVDDRHFGYEQIFLLKKKRCHKLTTLKLDQKILQLHLRGFDLFQRLLFCLAQEEFHCSLSLSISIPILLSGSSDGISGLCVFGSCCCSRSPLNKVLTLLTRIPLASFLFSDLLFSPPPFL